MLRYLSVLMLILEITQIIIIFLKKTGVFHWTMEVGFFIAQKLESERL